MLRSVFIALGICCLILGAECMFVEKAEVVASSRERSASGLAQRLAPNLREVEPPEWAPWSLMSAGAVVILYSFTIPQKMKQ